MSSLMIFVLILAIGVAVVGILLVFQHDYKDAIVFMLIAVAMVAGVAGVAATSGMFDVPAAAIGAMS